MEAFRDHLKEVGEGEIDEEDDEEVGEAEGFGAVANARRHEEKRDLRQQWPVSPMVTRESSLGSNKKERSLARAPAVEMKKALSTGGAYGEEEESKKKN